MEQDKFDLLKLQVETLIEAVKQLGWMRKQLNQIRIQLTRIADSLEPKPISHKQCLKNDLSWLEWCSLFLPSESLKKDIEEMAAELKRLDDETPERSPDTP